MTDKSVLVLVVIFFILDIILLSAIEGLDNESEKLNSQIAAITKRVDFIELRNSLYERCQSK